MMAVLTADSKAQQTVVLLAVLMAIPRADSLDVPKADQ
jgi:hypothetical protein